MIYLDNNATTSPAPEVRDAMAPFIGDDYANPSSPYSFARKSSSAIVKAREQVAGLLKAAPEQIIFTSGGTEGNNAVVRAALELKPERPHIVTTMVEHSSVRNCIRHFERKGVRVTWLSVDRKGQVDEAELRKAMDERPALVSIMTANNETGVIFPVETLAEYRDSDVLFHSDAVQAAGKIDIGLEKMPVDFITLSAHKLHGPKGIGALFARDAYSFPPFIIGGDQERGRRGGTENVAGIVGFGAAAALVPDRINDASLHMRSLRGRLESGLHGLGTDIEIVAEASGRLPNTVCAVFREMDAEAILTMLDMENICVSSGSACQSGSSEASPVLKVMGYSTKEALRAIRFSFNRYNDTDEVETLLEKLDLIIRRARKFSSA